MAAAIVCVCRHCVVLAHDRMVDGAVLVRSFRLQARQRSAPVGKSSMLSYVTHAGMKSIASKTHLHEIVWIGKAIAADGAELRQREVLPIQLQHIPASSVGRGHNDTRRAVSIPAVHVPRRCQRVHPRRRERAGHTRRSARPPHPH